MATTTQRPPVRLQFSAGQVLITPQDMDTFVLNAERAIEACQELVRRDERLRQFQEELLVPLHSWCTQHAAQVRACYVPLSQGIIRIFIVTTATKFDFDFATELAALERAFYQAGWRVALAQLPAVGDDSLGTFFRHDGALEVYAQSERA